MPVSFKNTLDGVIKIINYWSSINEMGIKYNIMNFCTLNKAWWLSQGKRTGSCSNTSSLTCFYHGTPFFFKEWLQTMIIQTWLNGRLLLKMNEINLACQRKKLGVFIAKDKIQAFR